MTTISVRSTTPISDQPTGAPGAPEPVGPRRRRRIVLSAVGALVAVAAVGAGVLLGQRATSPTAPTVGKVVTFPSDWQAYRAGERGDVVVAPLPRDWQAYRAGERGTSPTAPTVGTVVTFPSDWHAYRAGER